MSERNKWVKSGNGLWHSYCPVIRRQNLREVASERIAGIRERLENVIKRDGWVRRGRRWSKAA